MTADPDHVAILDDEPSIRTALGRLLKSAGMVVDSFADSSQFFAWLELKTPHCLILDLQMPGLNGLDILGHLVKRPIHIPTIIITGHDAKGMREACLNAGAAAYLRKPLYADHLIQTIREVREAPIHPLRATAINRITRQDSGER